MKKILVIVAALFVAAQSFAQVEPGTFTIQPTAGINISKTTSDHSKSKVGFVGGLEFGYKVNKLIALTAGAMYSCEGWNIPDVDGGGKANLSYINVPVLVNFYVVKGLALKAGVQPGFSVGGKMVAGGHTIDFKEFKSLVELNAVNFSVPVGISYEIKNFTIDARYNIGVSAIAKSPLFNDSNAARSSVFQIVLGYKIPLR